MRAAVLGSPIAHSLSPALHRAAYAALDLAWTYDAYDVDEARLPAFVAGLDDTWRGLSLTMPLKRVIIGLCDEVTGVARDVEAVNTVVRERDGTLHGSNTDVDGMVRALQAAGTTHASTATVVGGGATATSSVAALATLGVRHLSVVAREPDRARAVVDLAAARGMTVTTHRLETWDPEPCDVAVSTVPATAQATWAAALVETAGLVHDVVYDPWVTPLVAAARDLGTEVVGGFELLLAQAGLQVEAMTGCPPDQVPWTAMREAGLAALAARSA